MIKIIVVMMIIKIMIKEIKMETVLGDNKNKMVKCQFKMKLQKKLSNKLQLKIMVKLSLILLQLLWVNNILFIINYNRFIR